MDCGIPLMERRRNEETRKEIDVLYITDELRKIRLRWFRTSDML